jgi:GT2 family glycosyltransferase
MVKLTVIVLNYNGGAALAENLAGVWAGHHDDWEMIVVDNASRDGSLEAVEDRLAGVTLLRNRKNIGFAAAHNQALPLAKGEYILLLNPDVSTDAASVAQALEFMDANSDVAILGARILLPGGVDDPAAHRSFKTPATYFYKFLGLSQRFPRSRRFGHYYMTDRDFDAPTDVDSVTGAFLLIRARAQQEIGPLDERFFMYCEDEDWCWRAKQAGWRVVYDPGIVVRHRKGSSTRRHPLRMTWVWHTSLIRYHRKNIASRYPAYVNGLVYAGIGTALAVRLVIVAGRGLKPSGSSRKHP